MDQMPQYRVVGIRENGEREIVSTTSAIEVAQKVLTLIGTASRFKEVKIEIPKAQVMAHTGAFVDKWP